MEQKKLHTGINKLLIAELLVLFGTVIGSTVLVILSMQKQEMAMGFVAFGIIGVVLAAAIIQFVGLAGIRKINKHLNEAFWLVVGLIVISIINALLPTIFPDKFDGNVFSTTMDIVTIVLTCALIDGIREAVPQVDKFGKTTFIIYAIGALATCAIKVLDVFKLAESTGASIAAIIAIVFEAIYGIFFIIFLAKAGKATK